jgi:hypothetical protein
MVLGLFTRNGPALMEFPLIMLLLDWWPLGRFRPGNFSAPPRDQAGHTAWGAKISRPVTEKIPLFFISAAGLILISVQDRNAFTWKVPAALRLCYVPVAYVKYVGKLLLPGNLGLSYPYPEVIYWWEICGALGVLFFITAVFLWQAKKRPWLLFGWLWFLVTMSPWIGIVNSGFHPAMADRYAYIPAVGIFIIAAWGVPGRTDSLRHILAGLALLVLVALGLAAWSQAAFWKNGMTIYRHSAEVIPDNFSAWDQMGLAKSVLGDHDGAISCYEREIQMPICYEGWKTDAMLKIGMHHMCMGRYSPAENWFRRVLSKKPDSMVALVDLGLALKKRGRLDDAGRYLERAIETGQRSRSDDFLPHFWLAQIYMEQGRMQDAADQVKKSLEINPGFASGRELLSVLTKTPAEKDRLMESLARPRLP